MRLLLDENLPKRLKQDLKEHETFTAADKGWTGISNGKLLQLLIENQFDALLTFMFWSGGENTAVGTCHPLRRIKQAILIPSTAHTQVVMAHFQNMTEWSKL